MQLRQLIQGLTHLFYPHLCEGCNKPLIANEWILCISCEAQLPETGNCTIPENETGLRFAGRIPYIYAASFAYFTDEGLLQHLIHGLKYKNKQDIGRYLGSIFGQQLNSSGWIKEVDMIVPVPLHPAKLAARGFNQSELIAAGISVATGIPVYNNILLRTRNTESQTKKSRSERVDNMKNAFCISENSNINGKHILICDDILTTGATIEACALTLSTEKSIKISIATIGIAVS